MSWLKSMSEIVDQAIRGSVGRESEYRVMSKSFKSDLLCPDSLPTDVQIT